MSLILCAVAKPEVISALLGLAHSLGFIILYWSHSAVTILGTVLGRLRLRESCIPDFTPSAINVVINEVEKVEHVVNTAYVVQLISVASESTTGTEDSA